jgi:hypothetical protein
VTAPDDPSNRDRDDLRRRLTHDECIELLNRPLVGILSTLNDAGWIHSVPVFFLYRDGEIRILCGINSAKARNAIRTGRASFCVEVAETDRRYVTLKAEARASRGSGRSYPGWTPSMAGPTSHRDGTSSRPRLCWCSHRSAGLLGPTGTETQYHCRRWEPERDGYSRASRAWRRRYLPYRVAALSRASISEGLIAR